MSYPLPADVRLGVQYGPTGTEYTGTMVAGFAARMTVTLITERFTVTQKPKRVASHVVEPTSQQPSSKGKNVHVSSPVPKQHVLTSPDELWVRTNKETI